MVHDPRAVLTRPAPPPDLTVAYGAHPDQVADVRLPPGSASGPLLLFLHGGFWRSAYDRTHVGPLAADLAGRGYPVATLEYRRTGAPDGGWPATLDDVAAAVRAVPALIAQATDRLVGERASRPSGPAGAAGCVLAGHSAGGQLALWAAAGLARDDPPVHVPVLALAPVADLARAYALDLDGGAVAALLGGGPTDVPDRYAMADPTARLPLGVPVALVHGSDDRQVPVEFSRSFTARARAHGDHVTYRELHGVDHFGLIDPQSSAWPAVLAALDAVAPRAEQR